MLLNCYSYSTATATRTTGATATRTTGATATRTTGQLQLQKNYWMSLTNTAVEEEVVETYDVVEELRSCRRI